jgi:hypothetical protein
MSKQELTFINKIEEAFDALRELGSCSIIGIKREHQICFKDWKKIEIKEHSFNCAYIMHNLKYGYEDLHNGVVLIPAEKDVYLLFKFSNKSIFHS